MKIININTTYPRGIIAGGQDNTIGLGGVQRHSFIGGGQSNTVSAECASILGGQNNTVSGAYSSILGGLNNNDGGFPFSGIYGNGITAVAPDTFHVSCLNAVNTPTGAGPFPAGTISYTPTPVLPPGALGFLVIW